MVYRANNSDYLLVMKCRTYGINSETAWWTIYSYWLLHWYSKQAHPLKTPLVRFVDLIIMRTRHNGTFRSWLIGYLAAETNFQRQWADRNYNGLATDIPAEKRSGYGSWVVNYIFWNINFCKLYLRRARGIFLRPYVHKSVRNLCVVMSGEFR